MAVPPKSRIARNTHPLATPASLCPGKRIAKPSEEVRVGSVVALPLHDRVRILRVLSLPQRRGPAAEARACYEEVGIDEGGAPS